MYPIFRFAKEMAIHARAGTLGPGGIHVSSHICWPWDVDPWMELNNGRVLTLYDLGRIPMVKRSGFLKVFKQKGWTIAVAGSSVRYRRRVRMFQRFTMQSAILGWDQRFWYLQQTMWRQGEATSSVLLRLAMTDKNGILSPAHMAGELGWSEVSPALPDYVTAWIEAEAKRPWPPEI